jgi:hypothetical protein
MRKSILTLTLASTLTLGACASNPRVAQDAAIGGIGGAAVGAVVPGVSVIEGAAVGAAIGGLAGAVWTDNNNDGYVDGYVQNGQYYAGAPQGYDPTTHGVLTGALGGAALGAAAGAVIPGVSILQGAVIGAAVGGLAGAIWADRNNDGAVDGYVYNGQYYAGPPSGMAPAPASRRCTFLRDRAVSHLAQCSLRHRSRSCRPRQRPRSRPGRSGAKASTISIGLAAARPCGSRRRREMRPSS